MVILMTFVAMLGIYGIASRNFILVFLKFYISMVLTVYVIVTASEGDHWSGQVSVQDARSHDLVQLQRS